MLLKSTHFPTNLAGRQGHGVTDSDNQARKYAAQLLSCGKGELEVVIGKTQAY
jgi:hypothetical protein